MIDNVKASLKTVIVGERSAGPLRPTKNLSCFQHVLLLAQNDLDGFHPCRLEEEQTYLAVSKDYRYGGVVERGEGRGVLRIAWFSVEGEGGNREKRESVMVVLLSDRKIVTVLIYNKKLSFKKLSDFTRRKPGYRTSLKW